jgi:hypothetical protein
MCFVVAVLAFKMWSRCFADSGARLYTTCGSFHERCSVLEHGSSQGVPALGALPVSEPLLRRVVHTAVLLLCGAGCELFLSAGLRYDIGPARNDMAVNHPTHLLPCPIQ